MSEKEVSIPKLFGYYGVWSTCIGFGQKVSFRYQYMLRLDYFERFVDGDARKYSYHLVSEYVYSGLLPWSSLRPVTGITRSALVGNFRAEISLYQPPAGLKFIGSRNPVLFLVLRRWTSSHWSATVTNPNHPLRICSGADMMTLIIWYTPAPIGSQPILFTVIQLGGGCCYASTNSSTSV